MWEATIDMLTDAVYIFGTDKRLKKINRGGETLERPGRRRRREGARPLK